MDTPSSARRAFPLDGRLAAARGPAWADRVTDRTARPRFGLRGPGVPAWCAERGLPFPERVNRCTEFNGGRVARLGRTEILVLPDALDAPCPAVGPGAGVYDGYREEGWAWFRIEGPGTGAALAQLTSADLRPSRVRAGDVVQTHLAALDAVIVAVGEDGDRAFDIFADIASSDFLADVFADRCPAFTLCRDPSID